MSPQLRVLMVEDSEDDALLITRELKRAGYQFFAERVDSREALRAALAQEPWDLMTSDSRMPEFSGLEALELLHASGRDIPFIIVSGTIGEESAVAMMKAGAHDYVLKDNLMRLAPAVERELRDAESRRARRAAEEEVKRQREALLQSEKLAIMGGLLAGVAHELNNPLSIVMGQAGLLRRAVAGLPEEARVEKIERAAERCVRVVKNFLALARQHPPERRRVLVAPLAEETLELLAYPLRVDGIEVQREIAADLPELWADGHQLQQVLINLLTNAHHALRGSPLPRRVTLRAWHAAARRELVIEVEDNGPGIPAEVRGRIFEPFFTTKPEGQGTGLGLPLCVGIVESHGGRISAELPAGEGARFRVALPLVEPQREPVAAAAAGEPVPAPAAGKALVVDDEPAIAELLADLLGSAGHAVDMAHDGRTALDRMGERRYDIVLCDLRMPVMDGPQLYREAARRQPGIEERFVFLTGDTLAPEARKFLEEAGRPHLAKPFELSDVERVVARVLGSG